MKIRAFITHKLKEQYSDCQDRFSINSDTKSISLCDGMSQSLYPDLWADILSKHFTKENNWKPLDHESIEFLAKKWKEEVFKELQKKKEGGEDPWLLENNLLEGRSAGSTFIGCRFTVDKWNAVILGDSTIIKIHNYQIDDFYSSMDLSNGFDNYPDFFDSNQQRRGKGIPEKFEGELHNKDVLLISSDPFSDLLFNLNKEDKSDKVREIIERLLQINSHGDFCSFVEELRNQERMHNDDTCIIVIEYDGNNMFEIVHEDNIDKLISKELEPENEFNNNVENSNGKCSNFNNEYDNDCFSKKTLIDKAIEYIDNLIEKVNSCKCKKKKSSKTKTNTKPLKMLDSELSKLKDYLESIRQQNYDDTEKPSNL